MPTTTMQVNKHMKTFILAVALVIFTVQMVFAFIKYSARPTMSSPGTETLTTLNKPIFIAVCKSSQFDYLQAKNLGYTRPRDYFSGNVSRNDIWSWTGLSGNRTINETINYIYKSNLENVHSTNATVTNRFFIPHGRCKILEDYPKKMKLMVDFQGNGEHSKYLIFVFDPTASTNFVLPYSFMQGNNIEIEVNPTHATYIDYNIKLKKTRSLTGDGSCIEYPNDNFKSYAECIDIENEKKILPALGCMVPWMSKKNQCEGHIKRLPGQEKLAPWLIEKTDASWAGFQYESVSCPLPCTIISAYARHQQTTTAANSTENQVWLFFENKVQVETIVIAYDFVSLLVEIGSSLGLWLGLSVIGIFDVVVVVINKTNTFILNLVHKFKQNQERPTT